MCLSQASAARELLTCLKCRNYISPPILQCEFGHLMCEPCVELNPRKSCHTCGTNGRKIANLALEAVAAEMIFPCKFAANGCKVLLTYDELKKHRNLCVFLDTCCMCRFGLCKWIGEINGLVQHLKKHNYIATCSGDIITLHAEGLGHPHADTFAIVETSFQQNFLLVLKKVEWFPKQFKLYAMVQYIGAPVQAKNYDYCVEIMTSQRSTKWQSEVLPIHEDIDYVAQRSQCLVIDMNVLKWFTEKEILKIQVTILPLCTNTTKVER